MLGNTRIATAFGASVLARGVFAVSALRSARASLSILAAALWVNSAAGADRLATIALMPNRMLSIAFIIFSLLKNNQLDVDVELIIKRISAVLRISFDIGWLLT
jgi:hypothetical protein